MQIAPGFQKRFWFMFKLIASVVAIVLGLTFVPVYAVLAIAGSAVLAGVVAALSHNA